MTYLTTVLTDQKTNISFQKTTITSEQNVTTSWTLVEGGQISYTPSSTDANVFLEFTTAFGRKDATNSIVFRVQIGDSVATLGDVVTNNVDYYNGFGTTSTARNSNTSDTMTLKYKLAGWAGEKVIQIQCQTYNSSASLESIVNAGRKTSTGTIFKFNPFFKIYEA